MGEDARAGGRAGEGAFAERDQAAGGTGERVAADGSDTTRDAMFGGRLVLHQPRGGHRSGTDAVLLAAAAPPSFAGYALDVGAGAGAVGLGVALANPAARVRLVERDRAMLRLAAANIAANDLVARVAAVGCDVLDAQARRAACFEPAALVLTNPPFFDPASSRSSPVAGRRAARTFDAPLAAWIAACLDLLAPRGLLIVIHAASAVPELLAALGSRAGGAMLKGIHPRRGAPARRVLLRATLGSRAPFALVAPLVLHDGEGFTSEAESVHRGEAALDW